jgi:nucleoside 2-deoxyribosyltransferase
MKIKVFFSASSDVSEKQMREYKKIIRVLEGQDFEVLQVIFRKKEFEDDAKNIDFKHIYERVIKEINSADIFVAEISSPSGGVGYQVYHAFYQKKPMIILYTENKKTNPSMVIRGMESDKVFIHKYKNSSSLRNELPDFVSKAKQHLKVRFNLVISNREFSRLESESKKQGISITEYIRRLIANDERSKNG